MRFFIVGAVLLLSTTTAVAQSRWTLSAGPEWQPYWGGAYVGGRVRGEFDLLKPQGKAFRLRMELGGYWEPTQDRFFSSIDGSTFTRERQSLDMSFGFSAAATPLPRARFAPYVTIGILARQTWVHGNDYRFPSGGQPTYSSFAGSLGELAYPVGVGLRARLAGRTLQFELRRFLAEHRNALTMGTTLPF